jgi:polysaccharide pyruvyl transferase WcaK-like protein
LAIHKEISMPTVLLAGASVQDSVDETLLAAFHTALPEWRIATLDAGPSVATATDGVRVPRARGRRGLRRAVLDADAVVLSGGTVFTTLHPSTGRPTHDLLTWALLLASGGQATGKPVAMLGVGAGTLPDARARWLARALVRRADLLVLCDEESAHTLAAIGAPIPFRVGADPAWTLVDQAPLAPRDREGVVVALDHVPGDSGLADRLATGLRPLLACGMKVELQTWRDGDPTARSGALASAVADRLEGRVEVTAPPANVVDARVRLAGTRLVICLSSHAMIAAAAAGTPVVAVTGESKLVGLARRLQQPAVPVNADPTTIATTVRSGLDGQPASLSAVHAEIARAAEGFRLLRLLLNHGITDELDSFGSLSLVPSPWTAR